MKKYLLAFLIVASLSFIFHFLGTIHTLPWEFTYSDVAPFAKRALSPGWMYLDKKIEYPVITGMFVQLMGRLGRTATGYFISNGIFEILLGFFTTYFLLKLRPKNLNATWVYWILAPSLFVFLHFNWDILGIFFSILAFYLIKREHYNWAGVSLALGFCSKLFPVVFMLPLLVKLKTWPERIKAAAAFVVTTLVINGFFVIKNFDNWLYFYRFNAARALNPDSIWTAITPFFGPYLYDVKNLNALIFLLMIVCFSFVLWKYRDADIFLLSYWIILLFFIFNKIFTPQYILWLLPFFVIAHQPKKTLYYGLELSNLIIIFGYLHFSFTKGFLPTYAINGVVLFTIIRHIFLIAILLLSVKQYELENQAI
ncbi:MAG TPA: glycosyltransferase 87 family protein [Patescibacteria group bacterium]